MLQIFEKPGSGSAGPRGSGSRKLKLIEDNRRDVGSAILTSGAYLGFCQGGCTFLADLPPPPPDLDPDPDQDFELDLDPAPDPHQNNADPQQCCGTVTIYYGSGSGSDF